MHDRVLTYVRLCLKYVITRIMEARVACSDLPINSMNEVDILEIHRERTGANDTVEDDCKKKFVAGTQRTYVFQGNRKNSFGFRTV